MADALGDVVEGWITHNEPWVVAFLGHADGTQGAGRPRLADGADASPTTCCSRTGWRWSALRATGRARRDHAEPRRRCGRHRPRDDDAARRMDGYQNRWFLDPVLRGSYPADMVEHYERRFGPLAVVREATSTRSRGRSTSSASTTTSRRASCARIRRAAAARPRRCSARPPTTAMGWEVDPDGLHELLAARARATTATCRSTSPRTAPRSTTSPVGQRRRRGPVARSTTCGSHLEALRAGDRRRRRRPPLLRLVAARQLRVGARLRQALRDRATSTTTTQERMPKRSALWYRDYIAGVRG